jgi:hypothetical protein
VGGDVARGDENSGAVKGVEVVHVEGCAERGVRDGAVERQHGVVDGPTYRDGIDGVRLSIFRDFAGADDQRDRDSRGGSGDGGAAGWR